MRESSGNRRIETEPVIRRCHAPTPRRSEKGTVESGLRFDTVLLPAGMNSRPPNIASDGTKFHQTVHTTTHERQSRHSPRTIGQRVRPHDPQAPGVSPGSALTRPSP